MTESEAVEKLKNMRLFMQLENNKNECKFTKDDYKANEMAIQVLEKQIPTRPRKKKAYDGISYMCESCGAWITADYFVIKPKYCIVCGQKLDWSDVD
jgi:hypothetical protein